MTSFQEIFLWIGSLYIPILLAVLGAAFWKHPQKTISGNIGYRTRRSRQSQAAWDAAQKLSGKYLCILGIAQMIAAPVVLLLASPVCDPFSLSMICMTAEVLLIAVPVIAVEHYLKIHFPKQ